MHYVKQDINFSDEKMVRMLVSLAVLSHKVWDNTRLIVASIVTDR